jgi:hypothetical protein
MDPTYDMELEAEITRQRTLLKEIFDEGCVDGSNGINFCKFCGHSWPDLNGGAEGHHDNCVWLKLSTEFPDQEASC